MSQNTPEALEAKQRRSWDSNAAAWTQAVRQGHIQSRQEATNRAVLQAVTTLEPRAVLDVGCGEGWLAHALAQYGCDVVGVDSSRALVDAARQGPGTFFVSAYHALMANPTLAAGPFDVAVCNFSLLDQHLHTLLVALRERLRSGGWLVVQTVHPLTALGDAPYRDGWREEQFGGFAEPFSETTPETMPWYYRTLGSWVALVVGAGYSLMHLEEPVAIGSGKPWSMVMTYQSGLPNQSR